MPAPPPIAYATLSAPLPDAPYVLGITPSPTTPHLVLRHPSKSLTVADNQTLQSVASLQGAHGGHISSVSCDGGELWSAAVDGSIIRWDERSRQKATVIKGLSITWSTRRGFSPSLNVHKINATVTLAFIRKPLPVTALTTSAHDSLVIGGTELVSSEAHILFWDPRNSSAPLYTHSSTHSDDITHLSLLRSSSTFLPASHNPEIKTPSTLLLSASTDGLIALSDMKEGDEEEALVAEENWGQSIADAGGYMHKGKMGVWARSDMDEMCLWGVGRGNMGEIEVSKFRFFFLLDIPLVQEHCD